MPSYPQVLTRNMAGGGAGAVVNLGGPAKTLTITAGSGAEAWVRPRIDEGAYAGKAPAAAPSTPGASPAGASGDNAAQGWVHLVANGFTFKKLVDDGYQYIELWEVQSGDLRFDFGA